jgi:hypothetical protein
MIARGAYKFRQNADFFMDVMVSQTDAGKPLNSAAKTVRLNPLRSFRDRRVDSSEVIQHAFQQLLVRFSHGCRLGAADRFRFHSDSPRSSRREVNSYEALHRNHSHRFIAPAVANGLRFDPNDHL